MSDLATPKKAAKPGAAAPKIELPKIEIPEMVRDFADKGVQQAKETYSRFRTAAEETTDMMEDAYSSAAKGAAEFNLKALEAIRENVNASFDYFRELLATKTLSEAVEVSATHVRKQFTTLSTQAKELSEVAQKVTTEASEPIRTGVSRTMKMS